MLKPTFFVFTFFFGNHDQARTMTYLFKKKKTFLSLEHIVTFQFVWGGGALCCTETATQIDAVMFPFLPITCFESLSV